MQIYELYTRKNNSFLTIFFNNTGTMLVSCVPLNKTSTTKRHAFSYLDKHTLSTSPNLYYELYN